MADEFSRFGKRVPVIEEGMTHTKSSDKNRIAAGSDKGNLDIRPKPTRMELPPQRQQQPERFELPPQRQQDDYHPPPPTKRNDTLYLLIFIASLQIYGLYLLKKRN